MVKQELTTAARDHVRERIPPVAAQLSMRSGANCGIPATGSKDYRIGPSSAWKYAALFVTQLSKWGTQNALVVGRAGERDGGNDAGTGNSIAAERAFARRVRARAARAGLRGEHDRA